VNGVIVLGHPSTINSVQGISYAIVASLIVGVARAWELVGDRHTGIIASIAVLAGHDHPLSALTTPDLEPDLEPPSAS
jgi:hypothetical protein